MDADSNLMIMIIIVYSCMAYTHTSVMCFTLVEILKEKLKAKIRTVQCMKRRYTHRMTTLRFENKKLCSIKTQVQEWCRILA